MMMNGSLQNCKPLTNVANYEGKGEEERAWGQKEREEREEGQQHTREQNQSELLGMILCRRPPRLRSYNRDHSLDNV